jgi:hypothetical protein
MPVENEIIGFSIEALKLEGRGKICVSDPLGVIDPGNLK